MNTVKITIAIAALTLCLLCVIAIAAGSWGGAAECIFSKKQQKP